METLDDLLIKRRRGALGAADERRLESALRASREYELALLAQDAFDRDGEPRAGDAERLRELVEAVERRLPPVPRHARAWRIPLRIAIPVLVAGAAAAAVALDRPASVEGALPVSAASTPPPEPSLARESVARESVAARAQESSAVQSAGAEPAPPAPEERPAHAEPRSRAATLEPRPSPAPAAAAAAISAPNPATVRDQPAANAPQARAADDGESAQRLFRRANQLRQHDWPAAARLYAELIRRYPSSNEAGVSQVALGKWSLAQGRSGDALDWFRAHQRRAPGALTAEALFGEARALESIGSLSEAREPWRRLLEMYPHSPYANVARQRLGSP